MDDSAGSWLDGGVMVNQTASNSSAGFRPLLSPVADKAVNILVVTVTFITMVSLGCSMEVSKIKAHMVRPRGVAIALLAQYGVMPLTAYCLVKVFRLTEMAAVAVLICGCCPGGNLSNLLALAVQGDMNLSILMTSCSTLLALAMMPLLLYIYCRGIANLQGAIPYADITATLLMVLIPCGVGILINYYRPKYSKTITKVGVTIMTIAVVVFVTITCVEIGGAVLTLLPPAIMVISALMPLIGCSFGYIISSLFKLSQSECRTVSVETGCQNVQLCSTILKLAFPPAVMGPLFLFPMAYPVFQLMEAAVFILLFRCRQWLKPERPGSYQPAVAEHQLNVPPPAAP